MEPVGPIASARQRSQIETRRRLLDAATTLYFEQGARGTRTNDVAAAAGVAVGTVYLHFKDKDALLAEILRQGLVRMKQELAKLPADDGRSGYAAVRSKMTAIAAFCERYPAEAAILFDPGNLTTAPGQEIQEFLTDSQERGLLTGIADGYYRGDLHSGLVARALVGILLQVLGWWARNPGAVSRGEVIEVLTEIRMNGLQPTL